MEEDFSTESVVTAARKLRSQVTTGPRDSSRTRSPIRVSYTVDSDSESSRASSAGRGKRQTRGTGIARARAYLREAKEEATEAAFNQALRDRTVRKEVPVLEPEELITEVRKEQPSQLSAEELRAFAGHNVSTIVQIAAKSGKMKGNFAKLLKDSAAALQEVVDALASRTEAEETRRLTADNVRLRDEVTTLKNELKAHRREFAEMRSAMAAAKTAPTPNLNGEIMEELKASIVSSIGTILDARFAGIEERLLPEKVHRPPLAGDKKKHAALAPQPTVTPPTSLTIPMTQRATAASSTADTSEAAAGPSQTQSSGDADWATVVRKGKKKSKKTAENATPASAVAPAAKSSQPAGPRLTSPKTSAVVVTLQPEAAERGVTYAQILERAEQAVNLQELGIGEGVRIRRAATGARVLELPKDQTPEQAELLANRLRTALDGVASVVRPTKSASLRITGLDDSVTREKVAAAVARAGNCPVQTIKAGELLSGPRGMSSVTVHCPIEVAILLSNAGKLLVGWSSAEVRALEQRPLRCYKCLYIGHTRPMCPSTVDRGNLCFRCGHGGHKSFQCTASMRCMVCAEAGLPTDHLMGGKSCNPPPVKGGMVPRTAANVGGREVQEEAEMSS